MKLQETHTTVIILLSLFLFVSILSGETLDNKEKKAFLICFRTDDTIYGGCEDASRQLKSSGWNVIQIPLEGTPETSGESIINRLHEKLLDQKFSPTVPFIVHGHGKNGGSHHHIEYARTKNGDSSYLSSDALLKEIRSRAPNNPVWISSCHSGCELYQTDVCAGSSCLSGEFSYTDFKVEKTLTVISDLISDDAKFKVADTNRDGALSPSELNLYFCSHFKVGQKQVVRITTRARQNDPVKGTYSKTIYVLKNEVQETVEKIQKEAITINKLAKVSHYRQAAYRAFVYVDDTKVPAGISKLEERLFSDLRDAETWAYKNIEDWPCNCGAMVSGFCSVSSK